MGEVNNNSMANANLTRIVNSHQVALRPHPITAVPRYNLLGVRGVTRRLLCITAIVGVRRVVLLPAVLPMWGSPRQCNNSHQGAVRTKQGRHKHLYPLLYTPG